MAHLDNFTALSHELPGKWGNIMRNQVVGVLVAVALMGAGHAQAKVLYSVSGTWGDVTTQNGDISVDLTQFFPPFEPAHPNSSPLKISYSGPTIVEDDSMSTGSFFDDEFTCLDVCTSTADFQATGGDDDLGLGPAEPIGLGKSQFVFLAPTTTTAFNTCDDSSGNPITGNFSFGAMCDRGVTGHFGLQVDIFADGSSVGQPYSFQVSSVPEPATWALMLTGVAALGGMLRWTRRRQASPAALAV